MKTKQTTFTSLHPPVHAGVSRVGRGGGFLIPMENNNTIVDVSPAGIELENHYWIDCGRINTKEKLVEWIYHLCEKNWITPEHIRQLIDGAAQINGWKIYVNS
jgi:hypothetical protein